MGDLKAPSSQDEGQMPTTENPFVSYQSYQEAGGTLTKEQFEEIKAMPGDQRVGLNQLKQLIGYIPRPIEANIFNKLRTKFPKQRADWALNEMCCFLGISDYPPESAF